MESDDVTAASVDTRRAWLVLVAYIGVVAASHALWISFASITDEAAVAFHTTPVSIGSLVSVGPICSAVLSIPAGALPDRYGYRSPVLWAALATAIFAFLRPLAGNFPALLVLTIALLVPQPFLINAIADLVNRHFRDEEAATAAGLGTMAIFLGIAVGVALTPPLVTAAGIRGAQVVYAAVATAALLGFWRVAPRHVPDRLRAPEELPIRTALRRVVRSTTLWQLSAVLFCGFGYYLGMTTWLGDILEPRGIGESSAGVVAGTITIGGIAGSVALGVLSDRLRRRKPFIIAAGVVSIPTVWLLGHLDSFLALEFVAAVLGFFLLAALPVAIAMISEDASLGPQVASTGVGVMLAAGNIGGALLVLAMGALNDAQGDFTGAVALASGLAVVALLIATTLHEPRPA